MQQSVTVLKGTIIYSKNQRELEITEKGFLVCADGLVQGVYRQLPELYKKAEVTDYKDCLILPGLVNLHTHAPQYAFRGLGMDLELLDWLEQNTFPEEAKFADLTYAKRAYEIFAERLKKSAVTRACIFATVHREATLLLMDRLEASGLVTMVGKVNMDRNAPEYLREESAAASISETKRWLREVRARGYRHTLPILTPRFTPSCSDALMEELKRLQTEEKLPLQSHLSENPSEAAWVRELCPWAETYADAYARFGLFGGDCPTVMAHCVYSGKKERQMLKERGVFVAHCPESNMNLSSGIAPVRRYLDEGIPVGLGTDLAAGSSENMFAAMAQAVQVSKLRWRLQEESLLPLTAEEAFYLATKGGGAFFGKVGAFLPGYEGDAVVIDDSRLAHPQKLSARERLERLLYLADEREVCAKYVRGTRIL